MKEINLKFEITDEDIYFLGYDNKLNIEEASKLVLHLEQIIKQLKNKIHNAISKNQLTRN